MSEMQEQLELSIIYTRLLKDLDETPNFQQRLQLVDDAFRQAHSVTTRLLVEQAIQMQEDTRKFHDDVWQRAHDLKLEEM